MTISELLRRVEELDLKRELPRSIENTSGTIAEINRSQLYEGLDSKNVTLNPIYSNPFYAEFKQSLNSRPPNLVPDLRLTGAFYDAFEVTVDPVFYEIDSSDEKSEHLKLKYGDEIFGLTPDSKSEYANEILFQELKEYIISVTGLGFNNV